MQGISSAKHQHLVDALLHLEKLLSDDIGNDADQHTASELRHELESIYEKYETQLHKLSALITEYHDLVGKTKTQFLSPKLKELKKQALYNVRVSSLVEQNINLLYGT